MRKKVLVQQKLYIPSTYTKFMTFAMIIEKIYYRFNITIEVKFILTQTILQGAN